MRINGVRGSQWVDFNWLSPLGTTANTRLIRATQEIEDGLVDLWARNVWTPGQTGGAGLVFPVDRTSIRRVHEELGQVHVGYAVCEGHLAAAVILHLGSAIGPYAEKTIDWTKRELGADKAAFIRSLCVHSDLRGFGIGREMLTQTRKRAGLLDAQVVVGHLRVSPEKDQRLAKAYADAGFDRVGDQQTTTIRQTVEHQWRELFGREQPVDIDWLPGSTTVELHYVPIAAPSLRIQRPDAKQTLEVKPAQAACA